MSQINPEESPNRLATENLLGLAEFSGAARRSIPHETQNFHFIFVPHGTESDAKFATDKVDQILKPDLKTLVQVVYWEELASPMNFPKNSEELRKCHSYFKKSNILSLPPVKWDTEFERESLSRNARVAFDMIYHQLNRDTISTIEQVYVSRTGELPKSDYPAWDSFRAKMFGLPTQGWDVQYQVEQAPIESVIDGIYLGHHHQKLSETILAGDPTAARLRQVRYNLHFYRSTELRDTELAKTIHSAFNPKLNQVHICVRGHGHAEFLTPLLDVGSTSYQANLSKPIIDDGVPRESLFWAEILKSKQLLVENHPLIDKMIFETVGEVLLEPYNGFEPEDKNRFYEIIQELPVQTFAKWMDRYIASQKNDLGAVVMNSMKWFFSLPEVSQHHHALAMNEKLSAVGIFD